MSCFQSLAEFVYVTWSVTVGAEHFILTLYNYLYRLRVTTGANQLYPCGSNERKLSTLSKIMNVCFGRRNDDRLSWIPSKCVVLLISHVHFMTDIKCPQAQSSNRKSKFQLFSIYVQGTPTHSLSPFCILKITVHSLSNFNCKVRGIDLVTLFFESMTISFHFSFNECFTSAPLAKNTTDLVSIFVER